MKFLIGRRFAPIVLFIGSLQLLIGCSPGPTVVTSSLSSEVAPLGTPVGRAAAELPELPLDSLAENAYPAEDGYPSAGLPAPLVSESLHEPATPTPLATLIVPTELPPTPTEPALPTAPPATFTPPALPQTSADEHYWFRRPIPEGGTVWTDKYYPYGGTRSGALRTHHGVEFYVTYDTPVLAVASGTVVIAGDDSQTIVGPHANFYGNVVVIRHDFQWQGQDVYTLYAHLNSYTVAVGQQVSDQDVIGYSGATGVADGPHLHFEVRVGTNSYDATRNPLLWLWPFPERGTIVGRVVFPDGSFAYEAPVNIHRLDGGEEPVISSSTYADDGVNSDAAYGENFAFDDVPAGYYEVFVKADGRTFQEEVWVFSRRTSFVEIVLER